MSVSTTGQKSFGIKKISVTDSDRCAKNNTSSNQNNLSINHLNFKESSIFQENEKGDNTNDDICLKPYTLKEKSPLVVNDGANFVLNENKEGFSSIKSNALVGIFF